MYSFRDLRRASKLNIDGQEYRMAILGNSATQFFANAIKGYANLEDINLRIYDADYDQIEVQLLDLHSR